MSSSRPGAGDMGDNAQVINGELVTDGKDVASFIAKLYAMLEGGKHKDHIFWGDDNQSITIKDPETFSTAVLPVHYKHSNYQVWENTKKSICCPEKSAILPLNPRLPIHPLCSRLSDN